MLKRVLRRGVGTVAISLALGLACWNAIRADLVILKDGFALQGKFDQETTSFIDPATNLPIKARKLNGFMMMDDGARRTVFSEKQVQPGGVTKTDPSQASDIVRLQRLITRLDNWALPPGIYSHPTDWNDKWDRTVKFDSPQGHLQLAQHLSILTPYFVRIDARRYKWSPHYLTAELDPDLVRTLLTLHPDLKMKGGNDDAAKRFRIFRFFVQARWYDKAFAELESIASDLPEEKDKVESARTELKKLVTAEYVDLVERAHAVGRHQWARNRLANMPQQGVEEKLLARVRTLQATYDTITKNLRLAHHFLEDLPPRVTDGSQRLVFAEAAAAIATELSEDTVHRLETFVNLAQQAERDKERNRTPDHTPAQLLALAVSGWLMGDTSAEAKVDMGMRLWRARRLVLEYQRCHDPVARQRMLAAYQKSDPLVFDELAQVIRFLPPPEPFELLLAGNEPWVAGTLPFAGAALSWALLTAYQSLPGSRFEFQANLPWSYRKGATYTVQLPPEYHQGRSYPVLFVLHEGGEKPEDMLKRWSALAAQHGYLLVAPEWDRGSNGTYAYSAAEHSAVVDVLRDLRRRFQIDSDRVFVSGLGQGGNMAFDVGLAHPDLFAGVLPVGGRPRYFAHPYWPNAQYLPFYVVEGDMSDSTKDNRAAFEHWVQRGYPALYVQYKGRGLEWFPAELPFMFDWMNRKKRAAAFPYLGRAGGVFGDEFQSMRATDNHFYWLSAEEINDRQANDRRTWRARVVPASFQAQIGTGNQINVNAHGFKRITIWLGQGMIDYEKPVTVHVNLRVGWSNRKVTPSLGTLLEDFYLRGDRQRLFWAKLEFNL